MLTTQFGHPGDLATPKQSFSFAQARSRVAGMTEDSVQSDEKIRLG
jgi:hypothetical protein